MQQADGVQSPVSFYDNFSVVGDDVALSVKPPIFRLSPSQASFKIEMSNRGVNGTTVNVSSSDPLVKPVRDSLEIGAGETKSLFVNYGKVTSSSALHLAYDGKAYVVEMLVDEEPGIAAGALSAGLEFVDPAPISHSITGSQVIAGALEFRNVNSGPLHNITFHASPSIADIIDFNVTRFLEAKPNLVYSQFIWVNRNRNIPAGNYSGVIVMRSSEGAASSLDISVSIIWAEPADELPGELVIEEVPEEMVVPAEDGKSLNVTAITSLENATLEGGITITSGKAEDEAGRNRTIGIVVLAVILIIGSIITWKLRPKERVIRFSDYVSGIRKEDKRKKS